MNTKTKVGFLVRIWLFGIFLAAVFAGAFFVFVRPVSAATEVTGSLLLDQTWTKAQSPYVVKFDVWTSGVRVEAGATLTIEPGVVVKFDRGTTLSSAAGGKIIAVGTSAERIVFTALTDDTVAGDTNGDGTATQPEVAFWLGVRLRNSADRLEFTELRYGDFCIDSDQVLIIKNNKFLDCGAGINIRSGFGGQVSDNEFTNTHHNFSAVFSSGFFKSLEDVVFERNHFSGWAYGFSFDDLITGQVTIRNNEITNNRFGFFRLSGGNFLLENNNIFGNLEYGAINFELSSPLPAQNNWWGDASGPFHPTLNPGGLGNEVWDGVLFDPWLGKETSPPPGRNPVIIIPGIMGTELFQDGELVWPNLAKMLSPTDEFMDVLMLNDSGISLNQIDVGDIIRNPLGLYNYSQSLIDTLIDSGYQAGVDLFVFPYDWRLDINNVAQALNTFIETGIGSDKKLDIIAHSMGGLIAKEYILNFGKDRLNKVIFVGTPHLGAPRATTIPIFGEQLVALLVNFAEIRKISRNMPSIYELLPNQDYFINFGGYLKVQSSVLNYADTKTTLITLGLNNFLIDEAEFFYNSGINNLDLNGIEVFNINGCNTGTLSIFKVDPSFPKLPMMPKSVAGDGTVPLGSSNFVRISNENQFYVKGIKHDRMMTTNPIKALIVSLLTGSPKPIDNKITQDSSQCKLRGKSFGIFSPVNVKIFDQNGNYAGPNELESFDNSIPGATYEVLGEEKFIFLPTDEGQVYQVELDAIDQGSFDLKIADVDGEVRGTIYYRDVDIVPDSLAKFEVSDTLLNNSISFDLLGNSNFVEISPASVLTEEESADENPPVTSPSLTGIAGFNGWFRSAVEVTLTATDDNSGILQTEYSLDGGSSWHEYLGPFEVSEEGSHLIQFFSTDRAGNRELIETEELRIDATPPEIRVSFDLDMQNFVFGASDNLDPTPSVVCEKKVCIAKDRAGNILVLTYGRDDKKNRYEMELKSLSYNGSSSRKFKDTEFEIMYGDRSNLIKDFAQEIKVENENYIVIGYKKKQDLSTIRTKVAGGVETKEKVKGLKLLELITDKGDIMIKINDP